MSQKILFICRHAPYGNSLAKEALDAILASSAYGQDLSVLFIDDGVFQLLPDQQTQAIESKSFSKMLPAFELYDINQLYVAQQDLNARDLNAQKLSVALKTLNSAAIKALMAEQDSILSF